MNKAARQIALLAGILILVCVLCRLATRNTYTAILPVPQGMRDVALEELRVEAGTPGVVSPGDVRRVGDHIRIPIRPAGAGDTWVAVSRGAADSLGKVQFRVGRFGTIYDSTTGGFTGDSVALIAVTAFCLAVAAIMLRVYRESKGPAFYSYSTINAVGFGLFALLTGLFMLWVTLRHLFHPQSFAMLSAYEAISGAGLTFVLLTAPAMLAFAAAMAVSNVALLRHEHFSPKNVLGIGIGVVLLAGEALAFWLYFRKLSVPAWEWRVRNTARNVFATAFAYFECILIGAVFCGFKAARHVPELDADYILILGCRFRKDGTLTPLLKGRVDRALAFWREQRATTGKQAVLVPSGGQGRDEPIAEAEAMRRYLMERGVPEEAILVEDRSKNTYQNMEFSRALIERERPGAKVVYATTNYHVFRSGVWASLAGLPAEGMGSRTKWWYWPNAFMRECVGLFMNRIPQELLLLALMIALFGALSAALR